MIGYFRLGDFPSGAKNKRKATVKIWRNTPEGRKGTLPENCNKNTKGTNRNKKYLSFHLHIQKCPRKMENSIPLPTIFNFSLKKKIISTLWPKMCGFDPQIRANIYSNMQI